MTAPSGRGIDRHVASLGSPDDGSLGISAVHHLRASGPARPDGTFTCIDAVTHGSRSSFRDWAAERTHTPHAVMEAALAHVVKNKAEVAYARSDLFEKRRALMESWSDYLAG